MSKSVLLIDDDPDDLMFFREAVIEINPAYKCFTSTNAEETLQQLIKEKIKPNFIFLDLNMPRINGKDCLRQIKKIPWLSQIPVIIYSTSKLKKEMEEVLKLGAFRFLIKPSTLPDIIAAIKKIIE
ncbi:MAG TPA: response regulator [Chitinophagaceae bacterium]|nr:response regulator [Chitinophagaceae bacterium]